MDAAKSNRTARAAALSAALEQIDTGQVEATAEQRAYLAGALQTLQALENEDLG